MWSQEEKSQLAMLPLLLEWDCRAAAAGDGMAGARFTAVTVKLDGDSCREGAVASEGRRGPHDAQRRQRHRRGAFTRLQEAPLG
jgi:hypothetical protein